jgi:hypothetical protein
MTALVLRVVCAWCRRVLVEGDPGAKTSHGLCPTCAKRFEQDVAA